MGGSEEVGWEEREGGVIQRDEVRLDLVVSNARPVSIKSEGTPPLGSKSTDYRW